MATSTSSTSNINWGQFFTRATPPTPPPPPQPQQNPSLISRTLSGAQRLLYSPARHGAEEAVQGFANRFTEIFSTHQEEITGRMRHIFTEALLRRCPENYHQLISHIHAFLSTPSQTDLDQIKLLLNAMDAPGIRAIGPSLNDTGVNALMTLRALLNTEVTGPPTALVVSANAAFQLQIAEGLLKTIIDNHEGALLQTFTFLSQSLNEPNGFFHTLRQHFNHPQHGVLAEGLAVLRQNLNGRACVPLRQGKEACETYRTALSRNASVAELVPLRQNLHEKMQLLLDSRAAVPQISAGDWTRLEQFNAQLQANAQPLAGLPFLTAQSDAPIQILTASFNAQRGMFEEAADLLVETIGGGISQLVSVARNAISPQAPGAAGPQSAAPPRLPSSGGDFLNISTIAAQGRRFLDSIFSSTGNALSQQGARSLASLLRHVFEKIRDHIRQGHPEQHHLLNTIDPMIQRLQGAVENSHWGELLRVLQDAFQFMQNSQVYFQGLRLPLNPVRAHVSAIPDFLQNINAHENALRTPADRAPPRVTDQDINQKKELLQRRGSSIVLAKVILEKFCGYESNERMYAEIYKTDGIPANELSCVFRQRLFEKIDQSNGGFFGLFVKWSAKIFYNFVLPIASFYTNSIIGGMIDCAQKGIVDSPSSQESKEEFLVKRARNWLAVTSGAYNQVARTPASQARDFSLMMEEAIRMPERNGGLTQNELYAATAKTALDTFGPRIKWEETIDQYFQAEIPSSSSLHFLNPLVLGLNAFCSFCLKGLVFIPQWIGNQILQAGAKVAFGFTPILQSTTEQGIESLRRNTPASYAMQRVIYRKLQKVLQSLQQGLNDESNIEGGLGSRNTQIKRAEITGLVAYLMEVLNKSQYRTQDRLNDYLRHRAPIRDRAGQELDDTFIPEVMEIVVATVSVSLSAMTQEDEMRQMLYDGLCIANDSFDEAQPASDADFAAVERGIRELTDQILETAIFHAIEEKFDFTNEKQKRGIRHFIRTLKDQSNAFALQMNQLSGELADGRLSTQEQLAKISSMIECSSRYNRDRVDALGKADGNRNFHTETKHHLNELSRQLLTQCNPVAGRLNTMKTHLDQISFHDRLLRPLLLQAYICQTLQGPLNNQRLSSQDLIVCKTQLALFRRHLTHLQRHHCPLPLTDEMQRSLQEFATAVQKIEYTQKTEATFRSAYQIFSELKAAKLAAFDNPAIQTPSILERKLVGRIYELPSEQKAVLNQAILSLMNARNAREAEFAAQGFYSLQIQLSVGNFSQENQSLATLGRINSELQTRLGQTIQEFTHQVAVDKAAVRQHSIEASNQLRILNGWAQDQNELPIWNLFVFDMQWVTETVKNLAFDRAQGKIKQLFESLYQKHNYIGVINQCVLLPFLEHFGKHHLKK